MADPDSLLNGLIFKCPFQEEDKSCPFTSLRKMDVTSRFIYLNNLSPEEKEKLIQHHKQCLNRRERKPKIEK